MYMYTSDIRDSRARRKIINLRKAREREREKETRKGKEKRKANIVINEHCKRLRMNYCENIVIFKKVSTNIAAKKQFVFDVDLKKSRLSLREELKRYTFSLFFFLFDFLAFLTRDPKKKNRSKDVVMLNR